MEKKSMEKKADTCTSSALVKAREPDTNALRADVDEGMIPQRCGISSQPGSGIELH